MSKTDPMFKIEKKIFFPIYHFKKESEYFGTLRAQTLIPKAQFIAKEGNYSFFRKKWLEGNYYCKLNGEIIAQAYKPHGSGIYYNIEYGQNILIMKPGSKFFDELELEYNVLQDEELIGKIYQNPTKFLLNMEFESKVREIIQCFIFWLAFRAWSSERSWRRVDWI